MIRRGDEGSRVLGRVVQKEHRAGFGVAVAFDAQDHAVVYAWLLTQNALQIFRIDIHPGRCDDDVFLAAFEIKLAGFVHLREIAGMEPAVAFHHRLKLFVAPIAGGNIFAANQNFALRADFHFQAGKQFADGSFSEAKGMIQADEGGGFGHAVTLDHRVAETIPKGFDSARQRRTS